MPSGNPLISVIMPAYNCAKHVTEAVNSIVRQTYPNWELLIGDDGSTDSTKVILHNFRDKRIKCFDFLHNRGTVVVRNDLIAMAKGDFIAFQDADDFSDSNRLRLQLTELTNNPCVGMVGCQLKYVSEDGRILRSSNKPLNYAEVNENIFKDNVFCGATMMISRRALREIGGAYRSYFNRLSNEDYDLSLLLAEKFQCYNLPQALYFYRQYSGSSSKRISVEKLLAKDIAIHLAMQRKEKGSDDLQDGNIGKLDVFFEQLKGQFKNDGSLVFRKYASDFMYNKLHRSAILASIRAVHVSPLKLINYRTLLYCVRKALTD
jgi:glycosyltransferase involved in cell wall biosynthesis